MKKVIKYFLIALVAVIFAGTFVFLYQKSQTPEATYDTYTAEVMTIEKTSVLTGTIEPRDEVLIKPQISGIISEVYKQAGDVVKSGEVIAKVKVIPEMTSVNSSRHRVSLAKINLDQIAAEHARTAKLYEDKLVSREEYEKSLQSYRQAKEELKTAGSELQIITEGISPDNGGYSTTLIRSTIDGLILDVPVKVGNSVIMSNTFNDGTTIATVADMSRLIFKGYVDETEVSDVRVDMPVKIVIGAMPDRDFAARVEYIAPKAAGTDNANRFELKAAVSIPSDVVVRAGYSANAEIILLRATDVLAIPEGAVEYKADGTFVYLLTDAATGTFSRTPVKVGLSNGVNIQIKSGLKKGDKVRGNIHQAKETTSTDE